MAKAKATPNTNGKQYEPALFALWRNKSKAGNLYFSGKVNGKDVIGYYTKTNNAKRPALKLYESSDTPSKDKKEIAAFWLNTTKDGQRNYLSGTVEGVRVVGFINDSATDENKQPYIRFYVSPRRDDPAEANGQQRIEAKPDENGDLPF